MTGVVAFTGKMQHGKTTCAESALVAAKEAGFYAEIFPFATPLKEFATQLGWDGKKDTKGRKLLQMIGTEIGRNLISEDLWVRKNEERINAWVLSHTGKNCLAIIDDLRFDNEALWVRHVAGGRVVTVSRPWYKGNDHADLTNHRSENGVSGHLVDEIILNDGTKDFLHTNVGHLVTDYLEGLRGHSHTK